MGSHGTLRTLYNNFHKDYNLSWNTNDTIPICHVVYYNSFFIFLYVSPVCHVITQFIKTS